MKRWAAALAASVAWLALASPACHVGAPPTESTPWRALQPPAGTRIGVALGSGSMHGLAHVGVIQELEARAVPVEVVAGTSVGALVGSLWASGLDAARIDSLWRSNSPEDFSRFTGSWQGLFSNEGLRVPLQEAFANRPMEAWPRRFGAVAANLATGERRLLSSGSGATAVMASSAVPIFYQPQVVNGERLVDGALVEPVPVRAARELGANFVIAVDVAYRPHEEEASGLAQYGFQAMHILGNALAAEQTRSADVLLRLDVHRHFMQCGRDALVAGALAQRARH